MVWDEKLSVGMFEIRGKIQISKEEREVSYFVNKENFKIAPVAIISKENRALYT